LRSASGNGAGPNSPGRVRSREGRTSNSYAFGHWGLKHIELIPPREGESLSREWPEARGPGIFRLGYATDKPGQQPGGIARALEIV
jgi:hypothetical protein